MRKMCKLKNKKNPIVSAEAFAKILLKDQMNKIEKVKEKLKC